MAAERPSAECVGGNGVGAAAEIRSCRKRGCCCCCSCSGVSDGTCGGRVAASTPGVRAVDDLAGLPEETPAAGGALGAAEGGAEDKWLTSAETGALLLSLPPASLLAPSPTISNSPPPSSPSPMPAPSKREERSSVAAGNAPNADEDDEPSRLDAASAPLFGPRMTVIAIGLSGNAGADEVNKGSIGPSSGAGAPFWFGGL